MMLGRIQEIDVHHIIENGLRTRTWLHVNRTIFQKMVSANVDMKTFVDHMTYVRCQPYMDNFFNPLFIGRGLRENLKYWLLKMCAFRLFYIIYVKKCR